MPLMAQLRARVWPVGADADRSFLHASAIYFASNVLSAAIPFVLLPVLTRHLSPSEYGEAAMFQTLVWGAGALVGLGTAGAVSRKYFDKGTTDDVLRQFVASCLQILLASGAFFFLLAILLKDRISGWLGLDAAWVPWAVVVAILAVPVQLRLGQWEMRRKPHQYGAMQNSQSLLNITLSLFLVVVLLKGADGRVMAQIVTTGTIGAAALLLLHRDRLLSIASWRPGYIREALAFGVPMVPHLLASFAMAAADRLLVAKELGLEEAGVYMVAVQIAAALLMVFDAAARSFTPWLFEQLSAGDAAAHRNVVRRTYMVLGFMLAAGLAMVAAGPTFVELVAGTRYRRAGEVIGWLAMGQVFFGMYLVFNAFIVYQRRTGTLSSITIASGAVGIVLLVLGIRILGLHGAAIAFCTTMALRAAWTWWAAQKCQPMPWLGSQDKNHV